MSKYLVFFGWAVTIVVSSWLFRELGWIQHTTWNETLVEAWGVFIGASMSYLIYGRK